MNATATITFKDSLLAHFEQSLPSLFGDAQLRRKAALYFEEKGIPNRKWEDYKYINPEAVLKSDFGFRTNRMREITPHDINEFKLVKDSIVIVIANGIYSAELSPMNTLPVGITISNIADAVVSNEIAKKHYAKYAKFDADPFVALNTAMCAGGVFVHVAKNVQTKTPIQIIHVSNFETPSIAQPRNLIVVEESAEAIVIESYETIGPIKTFLNTLTEVYVGPNAKFDHYRIQTEGENAFQMNTLQASVCGNSLYNTYTFTLGGIFTRNNLNILFTEKNGEAHLYGLYPITNSQVVDNHTIVDHAVPNCMSNELYKGVVNEKASATFNGKIFVRSDAQKTNAFQTNRNILLSDDATVNTKPQLEIYADDVKCSHGTSTGKVNEDAMFYLQARGIGKESARALLIRAFAEEVVDQVKIEELRDYIDKRIDSILK
ncbi:MAG: Fe-S cluster assembly protein SufD [Bacteroidetes bacterium]|nr:Fe-S cluster assembly protein SufD [Bacteroidota bacterium]